MPHPAKGLRGPDAKPNTSGCKAKHTKLEQDWLKRKRETARERERASER